MIFRLNYTKARYQSVRNDALEHNFGHVYPTYDDIRGYCKQHCRPVIHSDDKMTWSSVQDNADHQVRRLLEINPSLKATCVARHEAGWSLYKILKGGLGTDSSISICKIMNNCGFIYKYALRSFFYQNSMLNVHLDFSLILNSSKNKAEKTCF